MEFSRQEYWNGSPFPSVGGLPNSGIEPRSPALQVYSFCLSHQGSPSKSRSKWDLESRLEVLGEVLGLTWNLFGVCALCQLITLSYSSCRMCLQSSDKWLSSLGVRVTGGPQESFRKVSFTANLWDLRPIPPQAMVSMGSCCFPLPFLLTQRTCTPMDAVFSLTSSPKVIYGLVPSSDSLWAEALGTPAYFKLLPGGSLPCACGLYLYSLRTVPQDRPKAEWQLSRLAEWHSQSLGEESQAQGQLAMGLSAFHMQWMQCMCRYMRVSVHADPGPIMT